MENTHENHHDKGSPWQAAYEQALGQLLDLLDAQDALKLEIELQQELVKLLWELAKPPE